jgi:hypothetical protein
MPRQPDRTGLGPSWSLPHTGEDVECLVAKWEGVAVLLVRCLAWVARVVWVGGGGLHRRCVASGEQRRRNLGERQLALPRAVWREGEVALQVRLSRSTRGGEFTRFGHRRAPGDLRCDLKRRCRRWPQGTRRCDVGQVALWTAGARTQTHKDCADLSTAVAVGRRAKAQGKCECDDAESGQRRWGR